MTRGWMKGWAVLMTMALPAVAADVPDWLPPKADDVVVCLGDSITDGYTYGQILMQALKEAGKPVPAIVCAGVASDTLPQMAARFDRDVKIHHPKIVTLSAGTNDSLHDEKPEVYEKALREVVAKAKAIGAKLILLTPCAINPQPNADEKIAAANREKASKAEALGALYTEIIRKVAAEEGYPVAENYALMSKTRADGKEIMSPDGIHPNYLGQSLMARSILDAAGCREVALPKEFTPKLFPGVIKEWKMREAPLTNGKPQAVTTESVKDLKPDDTWKTYALPDPIPTNAPTAEDWLEQERRNGFGCRLQTVVGKGSLQAVATVESKAEKNVWINTGIGVSTLWINGVKIHEQGAAWTGFHAGKERIPAQLKPGTNTLVLELAGAQFFLSVTDTLTWETELR